MSVHKLFDLENEIGTQTTYRKGTLEISDSAIGLCLCLSALWCRNVLDGKGMLATKPTYLRASLLQAKGEMKGGGSGTQLIDVVESLGLKIASIASMHGTKLIHYVATTPGVYILRFPGHAMAAKTGDGGWFFLDPEEGLFLCTSEKSFEKQVWKLYGDKKTEAWQGRRVVSA